VVGRNNPLFVSHALSHHAHSVLDGVTFDLPSFINTEMLRALEPSLHYVNRPLTCGDRRIVPIECIDPDVHDAVYMQWLHGSAFSCVDALTRLCAMLTDSGDYDPNDVEIALRRLEDAKLFLRVIENSQYYEC
jgi:hypothetical protein